MNDQTTTFMPVCTALVMCAEGGELNNHTVSNIFNHNIYDTWCLLLIATEMKLSC